MIVGTARAYTQRRKNNNPCKTHPHAIANQKLKQDGKHHPSRRLRGGASRREPLPAAELCLALQLQG